MTSQQIDIAPIRYRDLLSVTRMTQENMIGFDRQFSRLVSSRSGYLASYILLPLNLLLAGSGYKAIKQSKMIGCAYLNLGSRRWMALQVDEGNTAAQGLYKALNYTDYHPHLFSGHAHDFKGLATNAEVKLETLSPHRGRRLYIHYLEIERDNGDSWASRIVGDLVPEPSLSGDYYRCMLANDEIGCLLLRRNNHGLKMELVLEPVHWGDPHALQTICSVLDAREISGVKVELHLGSSQHHKNASVILTDLGLEERVQERILMLKNLNS